MQTTSGQVSAIIMGFTCLLVQTGPLQLGRLSLRPFRVLIFLESVDFFPALSRNRFFFLDRSHCIYSCCSFERYLYLGFPDRRIVIREDELDKKERQLPLHICYIWHLGKTDFLVLATGIVRLGADDLRWLFSGKIDVCRSLGS